MNEKRALVEAALFVSENPLTLDKISKISGITSKKDLKEVIDEIKKEFEKDSHGIELTLTSEGYQFQVKDRFLEVVTGLTTYADISRGALRTLSLVAIKQPILQSEIIKIQGNKAYNYIKNLEKKGLINTEKAGRTRLIKTTKEFERYFGKSLKEIQERLKTKNYDIIQ
ncbi:MAG: SMC-Scp complex subunit ScpB [Candidatus Aenigmarchaeota archaeon]|nr:SMC-Scp complex subunit ScpB [Candidatus Aenigmarchaeota archaeon]